MIAVVVIIIILIILIIDIGTVVFYKKSEYRITKVTRGKCHRAAKQINLLSNIKQTTSQNVSILCECLAGNQINPLSNFFC